MITIIRWLLVLPAALIAWIAVDFLLPLLFNVLLLVGDFVRLAPIVEFFVAPRPLGYHIIVFVSYIAAVLAGAKTAPKQHTFKAAIVVAIIFALYRAAMTLAYFSVTINTEDTPAQYVIGSIVAFAGIGIGIIIEKSQYHRRI